MTTDYRALCAELVGIEDAMAGGKPSVANQGQALDGFSALAHFRDVADRARAVLAQPEPVGPTDEELLSLAHFYGIDYVDIDRPSELDAEKAPVRSDELRIFARAALRRFGHPTPQPIPVSERLPEAEDCDAEGRCWFLDELVGDQSWWTLEDRAAGCNLGRSHWLPHWALPLPGASGG